MRNILLTIAVILSMIGSNLSAGSIADRIPIYIVITQQEGGNEVPRTPVCLPVVGVVYEDSIILSFTNDVGDVSVCLEEEIGGLLLSTVVDSSDGDVEIPFSGAPGSYSITFNLSDGTKLLGTFIIMSYE